MITSTATSHIPSATKKTSGFTHETSTGKTDEWFTPASILTSIGLRYSLDVCSPGAGETHVHADRHLTITDDGLTTPWHGTVWMNPPYSDVQPWMRKLADHGDGIALVFNRTDTVWFQEAFIEAAVVCFVAGRIKFINGITGSASGTPGTGSALLAFGDTAAQALLQSGLGVCVRPVHTR